MSRRPPRQDRPQQGNAARRSGQAHGRGHDRRPRPANPDRDGFVVGMHAAIAVLSNQPERVRAVHCWSRDRGVLQALSEAGVTSFVPAPPLDLGDEPLAQGVAIAVRPFAPLDLDSLLDRVPPDAGRLLLVLDGITDTRNLGAIVRSAAFFGVAGVILPRDRAASITPAAERIARGGASVVPIAEVTNIAQTLVALRDRGWWSVGTALSDDAVSLWDVRIDRPLALVLGAEDRGIRPLVAKRCDQLAVLPALGPMQSLNVASFATAALAALKRPAADRKR
ncbi:MAG: RNA methyltransferase [Deltaproteobacteria bacterium]|nr:RNA methyltransferase [Deltaproteobacteria bacterium]